jgi:E3 ubiquitin-protein ligase SHPRH
MDQTDVSIRTEQRLLLTSKLKRGQLFENSPRVKEALRIWDEVAREANEIVQECREQLQQEIAKIPTEIKNSSVKEESSGSDDDLDTPEGQEE